MNFFTENKDESNLLPDVIFLEILKFLFRLQNNSKLKIDENKFKNALDSTSFENLKKFNMRSSYGFCTNDLKIVNIDYEEDFVLLDYYLKKNKLKTLINSI